MGFWIHITNPNGTILRYDGIKPIQNQTIPLHPGWNVLGYPSQRSYNITDGLNNLTFGTQIDAVWEHDAGTKTWKEMGLSDYFEIGKGYWIFANEECEWEVPL